MRNFAIFLVYNCLKHCKMKPFDYRSGQIIVFLPFILFFAEENSEPVMLLTGQVTGQNVYKNVDASRRFSGFQPPTS